MKKLALFIFFAGSLHISFAQQNIKQDDVKVKTGKNSEMKQYWFVMLTKGINRNHDSTTAAAIQKGHIDNIGKLTEQGKILVAGPFGDDGVWRGIFIMDCRDKKEAEELLLTDPAIKAGRLSYEIHPWWTAKNEVFK